MPPKYIQFTCKTCGDPFNVDIGTVNQRAKVGKAPQFCSRQCSWRGVLPGNEVTLACEHCGKPFQRREYRLRQDARRGKFRQFCSRSCATKAIRGMGTATFSCQHCGSRFERAISYVKHARKIGREVKFCSAKCRGQAKSKASALLNPRRACAHCGAPIKRSRSTLPDDQPVYCSKACFGASCRNSVMIPCATCGKVHPVQPHRLTIYSRHFCSRGCANAATSTWTTHSWGRQGKRVDLGHRVRSTWEANVCRVMRALQVEYEYEPHTFRMNGGSYTPDLRLADGTWIEIKGYAKAKGMQQLARFRAEYPNERLVLIDEAMYRAIEREWKERIDAWER